ncbi:hypothetical protein NXT3_PC01478 (plasmid) [Sinorhizobium fredii]|uniref:Uncharacterized protein n=1 Tax=Rhizobium fredii TaxID=380 RepID=A0A2L0HGN6_RHIFR|nr:hypothetical protein NXT3_PC01478 [Sinorhizobium fredii]
MAITPIAASRLIADEPEVIGLLLSQKALARKTIQASRFKVSRTAAYPSNHPSWRDREDNPCCSHCPGRNPWHCCRRPLRYLSFRPTLSHRYPSSNSPRPFRRRNRQFRPSCWWTRHLPRNRQYQAWKPSRRYLNLPRIRPYRQNCLMCRHPPKNHPSRALMRSRIGNWWCSGRNCRPQSYRPFRRCCSRCHRPRWCRPFRPYYSTVRRRPEWCLQEGPLRGLPL